MTAIRDSDFYSVAQAARELDVSPSTVWRWIAAHKLRAYRVGPKTIRIRRQDLEAVVQPTRGPGEEVSAAATRVEPPSRQELARRQALVSRILANREQRVIVPSTASDLIRRAREQEGHVRRS